jgi:hypothetical protein
LGLVLTGTLNAPYPDDPSEMDIVTWMQALSAMRSAAARIETLEAALRPFASAATGVGSQSLQDVITTGDLRAAAEALHS